MFVTPLFSSWYNREMHEKCPVCEQSFEPEPGYWFGAMYVSYVFSVALAFVVGIGSYYLLNDPEPWVYIAILVSLLAILWPFMYRYSRSIYIHVFGGIRFDANNQKK